MGSKVNLRWRPLPHKHTPGNEAQSCEEAEGARGGAGGANETYNIHSSFEGNFPGHYFNVLKWKQLFD